MTNDELSEIWTKFKTIYGTYSGPFPRYCASDIMWNEHDVVFRLGHVIEQKIKDIKGKGNLHIDPTIWFPSGYRQPDLGITEMSTIIEGDQIEWQWAIEVKCVHFRSPSHIYGPKNVRSDILKLETLLATNLVKNAAMIVIDVSGETAPPTPDYKRDPVLVLEHYM